MDQSNNVIENSLKESLESKIRMLEYSIDKATSKDTISCLKDYDGLSALFDRILQREREINDLKIEIKRFDQDFIKQNEAKIEGLLKSFKGTKLCERFYVEPKPDRKPMPIEDFMDVVKTSIPALMNRFFQNETYPGQKSVSDRDGLQGFESMVVDEAFSIAKMVAKRYGDISEKNLIGETW